MIIEIEGIDGVGKTTQCQLLCRWFESLGQRSIIVKDLESTELGKQIKSILITETKRTKVAELFAFLCCKAQLFSEVIEPEVANGTNVICDRGVASLLSYFYVAGFKTDFLDKMISIIIPRHFSSTTFLLDCDVSKALYRNERKTTRSKFDCMSIEFFEMQRLAFRRLAENNNWSILDASHGIEQIHKEIIQNLSK